MMKVLELSNICRKDNHIYYRREFKADALIEMMAQKRIVPIEFVLEMTPFGNINASVLILENIEYPVLPLISSIKTLVSSMDKEGLLP